MKDSIHKLLNVLKAHVNKNNKEIQFNQEEIDKLLSDISMNTRKKDLDSKYSLNRQLLNENADFVKMQLELSDFLKKYEYLLSEDDHNDFENIPEDNDIKSLINQTITGKLKFDTSHPQYNNPVFFRELLRYYEIHEDYEMCDKLLKYRKL